METVTSSPKRWWALVAIVLCTLTLGFDITILNVALPTLAADLDAGTSALQWIVDSYVLVFAGLLLPMGALGDRYGRRKLLLAGLALFALASLLAVVATGPGQVIVARTLMGVGAAVMTPLSTAIIPVMFDATDRPKAIALLTMGMGIGLPIGPILGGYLLEHFWWGSIFLVNVPAAVVAFIAVAALVPESKAARPKHIDLGGGLLSTAGLTLFVYGVIEAPVRGWTDPLVLGALVAGLALLAAFVVVERRTAEPMLDLGLFRRPRFAWGTAAGTIASFSLFGLLFVVPQFLQAVRGMDALAVGVRLLPLIVGLFVGAPVAARLSVRIGTKIPVVTGLLVSAAGLFVGTATGPDSTYGFIATWLLLIGLGTGLALAPAMDAVLGELPPDEAGSGTAVTMTLRQTAGALGVALLGSLLSAVYRADLGSGASAAARESIAGALATGEIAAARSAFTTGMAAVLAVCGTLAVAGAVLTARWLPARAAARQSESEHEPARVA
ncbi:MFS transporter [Virgisporangium aurantiacum]|uniref:MFS transporter n=1 Tax=Virgisporangium aurantiacum TaxID=175570 RepID=A0A8J3ZDG8_9ACTN|nr:MFS transporter [Virgisporangium aurantiacum]GIJ61967.1 MFS transporter [Virgisporangium aurantiacum]